MAPDPPWALVEQAARLVGYRTGPTRYARRARFLFEGIDLTDKRVLDVGCGRGEFAVWAGLCGAGHVLGIDPEAAGSRSGVLSAFESSIQELGLVGRVQAAGWTLQTLPMPEVPYDIVVMYNVINHLDEPAVVRLHHDPQAFATFVDILARLRTMLAPEAWVIIADCGRTNFWNSLGIKTRLTRDIEYHKHQNPRTWARVFEAAGYRLHDVRWTPLSPVGWLTGNAVAQYFLMSHFFQRFRNPGSGSGGG